MAVRVKEFLMQISKENKMYFLIIIGVAILIKILLFSFVEIHAPQSKFMNDSSVYLKTSEMLTSKGVFATQDKNGTLKYELNRTPGHPFFLSILHGFMGIPLDGTSVILYLWDLPGWYPY